MPTDRELERIKNRASERRNRRLLEKAHVENLRASLSIRQQLRTEPSVLLPLADEINSLERKLGLVVTNYSVLRNLHRVRFSFLFLFMTDPVSFIHLICFPNNELVSLNFGFFLHFFAG